MGSSPNADKLDDIVICGDCSFAGPSSHKSEKSKVLERRGFEAKFSTVGMQRSLPRASFPDIPLGAARILPRASRIRRLACVLLQTIPVAAVALLAGDKLGSALLLAKLGASLPAGLPHGLKLLVRAATKSVDNESLRLESQHSFYHARTAAYSLRAYKQRVEYRSIPDRGSPPRSFLAPYDHSTSSGSSTGYPESANSD